jgi:hypothetical protein
MGMTMPFRREAHSRRATVAFDGSRHSRVWCDSPAQGIAGRVSPVDAVAIARVVARGEALSSPRRVQTLADLKLSEDRDQLLRVRTQLANQPGPPETSAGGRP